MKLTPMMESFIFHCGEMGSRWGFNRTIGQIHALLVISEEPLHAQQIAETLNISRGNVSMGIKELQSWQLVQTKHIAGDRKDYYQPSGDIWDMANAVFEERRKREVDPTLSLLRTTLLEEPNNEKEKYAQDRMREMHDLLETVTQWSSELQRLNPDHLHTLMKLGSGISKVINLKDQLIHKPNHSDQS